MKSWLPILIVLFAVACESQARPCSQMGCSSGVSISVTKPGTYAITARYNGQTVSDTCTASEAREFSDVPGTVSRTGGPCGISIQGTPTSIHVTVVEDGATLHDQTHEPDYREYRPNGEHCEPVCVGAKIEIPL